MGEAARVVQVVGPGPELEAVRALFLEYANSLGFSLCFQDFDSELAALPGAYAPARGCLLLAMAEDGPAGCVGVRGLDRDSCEMKRLFVRPVRRGGGIGRLLAGEAVARARRLGYRCIVLDTLPQMVSARTLYREMGFAARPRYYDTPMEGTEFLELALA